jgi:hypothetical protein
MRDREREERNKRDKRNKNRNPTISLQMIIIFDRKLRLRLVTRPQKIYDGIYKVDCLCHYDHFQGKKNLVFKLKKLFKIY